MKEKQENNLFKHSIKKYEYGFSQIDNRFVNGIINLSPRAFKLHLYFNSLNPPYFVNKTGIQHCTRLSPKQITDAIKELESNKLLVRNKLHEDGKYKYSYEIFPVPYDIEDFEDTENQYIDSKGLKTKHYEESTEDSPYINNNNEKIIIKTKEYNNNQYSKKNSLSKKTNNYSKNKVESAISQINELISEDFQDNELQELMKEFILDKFERGKIVSKQQYKALCKKLFDISKNPTVQKQVISNTIQNGWSSFYPINTVSNSSRKTHKRKTNRQNYTPINETEKDEGENTNAKD